MVYSDVLENNLKIEISAIGLSLTTEINIPKAINV